MPIATVQLPNGKIADIEVPQGATPQEIESFVMSNPELGGQQPQTQPMQSPAELEQIAGKNQAYLQENLPASQGIVGLETVENVGRGINIGLGNAAVGAFQAATDVGEKAASLIERLYFGDNLNMDTIGSRLANQVKQRNELQAQLPTSQRVGVAIGQSLPYLATGVGTGAKVAQVAGKVAGLATGGAVSGFASGALSPQEEAGLENRSIQAVKSGAIGAGIGAGLGVAGKVASNVKTSAVQLGKDILAGYKARPTEAIAGFTSKPVETLDSISEAIKEGSSNAYKAMRESGAILKPETTKSIFAGIDDALNKNGFLSPITNADTIGTLEFIKKLAKEKNGAIGLEELDNYRQALSDVVKKNTDIAGPNPDALKANIAINKLDDVVESLGGSAIQKTSSSLENFDFKDPHLASEKVVNILENEFPFLPKNTFQISNSINRNGDKSSYLTSKFLPNEVRFSDHISETHNSFYNQNIGTANLKKIKDGIIKKAEIDLNNLTIYNKAKEFLEKNDNILNNSKRSAYKFKGGDFYNKEKLLQSKINPLEAETAQTDFNRLYTLVQDYNDNPEQISILKKIVDTKLNKESQKPLDLLNTAREEWKRYRKFDAITNIVRKADGDANRTKTLLQNFVNNPKNLRGFSPAEVEALKRAKTNSTAEGLMKAVGKFGFDIGSGRNAGNSALPIGSILIGGGTGGITAVVGTVARQAQKLSARGQIDDVLKLIQGQEPQIASKVIQQLSPKTRDFVLTNILTQTINKSINQ